MARKRSTRARTVPAHAIAALLILLAATALAGAATFGLGTDEDRATAERAAGGREPRGRGATIPRNRPAEPRSEPRIQWRHSVAIGEPEAGRLERGVKLPSGGRSYFTWDPIQRRSPNRWWRRWGTDSLVRTTRRVVREFAAAHPAAPRIGIGDLSRPHGGDFGPRYGLPGHSTHQNGLDVDVYYPRLDGRERPPRVPSQIDRPPAQDLVDRFVRAGAERALVGPNTALRGPADVVVPYPNHDNHLHVRLPG